MQESSLTTYEHSANGKYFLRICVGAHVAEAHTGEAAQSEVERRDVGAAPGWAASRAVHIGHLQPLAQLMQPAWAEGRMEGARAAGRATVPWTSSA